MKISYNWLKQYANISLSAEDAAQILTDTGLEVEGWEHVSSIKGGLKNVVVGHVKEIIQHPNADRLKVTMVDVGDDELLQIVCGAPNVAKDQKVIVALVGATLYPEPDKPFEIKKSKIRGEVSMGMLCAEDELGLGQSHDGIMILEDAVAIGTPASEFFEVENDTIFEIGLTPNRADAMGHVGVARDLVAFLNYHNNANKAIIWPSTDHVKYTTVETINVSVENEENCPQYCGVQLSDITVESSPNWLKNRLKSIGVNPINNVVDITNYVMFETGCPLHAFDANIVNGNVIVRNAKTNETIVTLDEVERKLDTSDLVIANADGPMCIAGVYGGINSGVSENTTSIFLEAAYFNPVSVRKTTKRHGLNTDASFRFERGVDPAKVQYTMERAISLLEEYAGAKVISKKSVLGEGISPFHNVQFNPDKCRALIGVAISNDHIEDILKNLDITIDSIHENNWTVKVPAYRIDVTRHADIVEEVLRIYGLNKIETPSQLKMSIVQEQMPTSYQIKAKARRILAATGGNEIINNTLVSSETASKLSSQTMNSETAVTLLNPLSIELDIMRQSLLPGALQSLAYNKNRQIKSLKMFEFGKTYNKVEENYIETETLLLIQSGNRFSESWDQTESKISYYDIKSWAEHLILQLIGDVNITIEPLQNDLYTDGIQLIAKNKSICSIGIIKPNVLANYEVKDEVFAAELDWKNVMKCIRSQKVEYAEIPKFPSMRRDFSLLLDKEVQFEEIKNIATRVDKKLLKKIDLFDVYEGDKLPEGKKSYAVQFVLQDDNKTLNDKQVDKVMDKIRKELEDKINAQLR